MNFVANPVFDIAKNQLINFAKSQLIIKLEEKLNQGDAGIDALFVELENSLVNSKVFKPILKTILLTVCSLKQEETVKTDLKEKIDKIDFSTELEKMKEKMPGITDNMKRQIETLPDKLKTKLKDLIAKLIKCDDPSAPVTAAGGSKQKRRQKTKKRIHKRSRGRKQHSRK